MSKIWLGRKGSEELLSNINRQYREEPFQITREARTASGRLVTDVIAEKMKFIISYSLVPNDVIESLSAIYRLGGILNLKVEQNDGSMKEWSVKIRPFARGRYLINSQWYWQDITLELEEV